jgi:hypothetical protein
MMRKLILFFSLIGSAYLVATRDHDTESHTSSARAPRVAVKQEEKLQELKSKPDLVSRVRPRHISKPENPTMSYSENLFATALPPLPLPASLPVLPPLPAQGATLPVLQQAAPPIAFSYIGKQEENGVWLLFLALSEQTISAKEGDTIFNAYRIESFRPPLLTVTHLPSNEKQIMNIGEFR